MDLRAVEIPWKEELTIIVPSFLKKQMSMVHSCAEGNGSEVLILPCSLSCHWQITQPFLTSFFRVVAMMVSISQSVCRDML